MCDDRAVTRPSSDPLAAIDHLIVDGTNLLHALRRTTAPAPSVALVGRLRAVIPPRVRIEVVLDGPPERGLRDVRLAAGTTVRYAGARSADAVIASLVEFAALGRPEGAANVLVVTDDRELRQHLGGRGATTARTAWLIGRLGRTRLSAPAPGRPRPPAPPPSDGGARDDEDHPSWQPGRGATTKRGNPRREPKRGRRP